VAPTRSQDRDVIDLTHFGRMREIEMPVAKESGVSVIILRNASINPSQLKNIINKYMQPSMLMKLLKLDLTNNNIGAVGASLLVDTFKLGCNLVHFSLAENKLGDTVVKRVVEGLCTGGCAAHLKKLDLRDNKLTLSGGVSGAIAKLTELLVLDLSYNSINVEGKSAKLQATILFKPLTKLQVLSLAYNRLHDSGVSTLFTLLVSQKDLILVDFSHCFLTYKSVSAINSYLKNSATKQLLLSGLICQPDKLEDLLKYAESLNKHLILEHSTAGIELLENFRTS